MTAASNSASPRRLALCHKARKKKVRADVTRLGGRQVQWVNTQSGAACTLFVNSLPVTYTDRGPSGTPRTRPAPARWFSVPAPRSGWSAVSRHLPGETSAGGVRARSAATRRGPQPLGRSRGPWAEPRGERDRAGGGSGAASHTGAAQPPVHPGLLLRCRRLHGGRAGQLPPLLRLNPNGRQRGRSAGSGRFPSPAGGLGLPLPPRQLPTTVVLVLSQCSAGLPPRCPVEPPPCWQLFLWSGVGGWKLNHKLLPS